MSEFFTFKQPVTKTGDGTIKPLFDPLLNFGIPNKYFGRHYVQRYYTKGRLHYLWDKLTGKDPQKFRFWCEVIIKLAPETREYIELMQSKENVEEIDTPDKYKNF